MTRPTPEEDVPSGRHGNYAQRVRHAAMAESEKPTVDILHHMDVPDEYFIRIDRLTPGGIVSKDELLELHDAIEEMFPNDFR